MVDCYCVTCTFFFSHFELLILWRSTIAYFDTDSMFCSSVLCDKIVYKCFLKILGEKVEDNNNDQSHFDYAIPVEDVNETQVLSLDDETQALNLGGETQTLDLVNETQALNFGDETQALNLGGETQALCYFDGAENMETQVWDVFDNEVANDSDNEGSDGTEVLGEGNCISDDDSARPGSNQPLDKEKMRCISVCEQGEKDLTERHDPSNLGEFSHLFSINFMNTLVLK